MAVVFPERVQLCGLGLGNCTACGLKRGPSASSSGPPCSCYFVQASDGSLVVPPDAVVVQDSGDIADEAVLTAEGPRL